MIQQLVGVVFHPARLRQDLAMLEASERFEPAGCVEAEGLAAGGALIDGDDGGHQSSINSTAMSAAPLRGIFAVGTVSRRSGRNLPARDQTSRPSMVRRSRPRTARVTRAR